MFVERSSQKKICFGLKYWLSDVSFANRTCTFGVYINLLMKFDSFKIILPFQKSKRFGSIH